MSKIVYNKLVRDRIPEIIRAGGNSCVTSVLSQDAYLQALDTKLGEELQEYLQSGAVEELADLLEVIYAAAEARGCTPAQLDILRADKSQKRGAFRDRIFLHSVEEKK